MVSVDASWADGPPVVAPTTAACRVTMGTAAMPTTASIGRCSFRVPPDSGGALVRGTVTVGGAKAAFSFRVG